MEIKTFLTLNGLGVLIFHTEKQFVFKASSAWPPRRVLPSSKIKTRWCHPHELVPYCHHPKRVGRMDQHFMLCGISLTVTCRSRPADVMRFENLASQLAQCRWGVWRSKYLPLQGNFLLLFAVGSSAVASAWESKWEVCSWQLLTGCCYPAVEEPNLS